MDVWYFSPFLFFPLATVLHFISSQSAVCDFAILISHNIPENRDLLVNYSVAGETSNLILIKELNSHSSAKSSSLFLVWAKERNEKAQSIQINCESEERKVWKSGSFGGKCWLNLWQTLNFSINKSSSSNSLIAWWLDIALYRLIKKHLAVAHVEKYNWKSLIH